ncbi:SGNH/GDSL hydrolase family protein [Candidatus Nitrospira allomarina]|uniref:SGNH/GDSL hydrolase family protein n=1 Tax=Candidatus Nitrospira allomarina TaxID=3020900 RepID=A0AA96G9Y1_9BACT|nr:SGNH/GDSL hydrolase family protein [Candidatus Nitrospira allomarina]WNM57636.1 SGNH/GDSL hydrolase family protein [Candidatus Nitrospira allomarina]
MIKQKSVLLYILLACLVYGSVEGISYLGLLLLQGKGVSYQPLASRLSQEQKQLIQHRIEDSVPLSGHHPVLGWAPKLHSHSKDVRINSQGIRADHDFAHVINPEVVRVSAFGDSFTFGEEVANEDTWEHQLEEQNPRIEVLNFGVGAYGLDQAYMRYMEDGISFKSDIVLIGFMSENIYRNLNVFRPFYHSSYATNFYTKPRFLLANDSLVLLNNPLRTTSDYWRLVRNDEAVLREIGNHDYFYQIKYMAGPMDLLPFMRLLKIATRSVKEKLNPVVTPEGSYAVNSEGFRLTTRLLEEFYCAALQHESLPVIIIFPDLGDFSRHRSHQGKRYEPLLKQLHIKGFRVLDILDALVAFDSALPTDRLTVGQWGHYSHLGNSIVATFLQDYLNNEKLTVRDNVKNLVRAACTTNHCCPNSPPRKFTTTD